MVFLLLFAPPPAVVGACFGGASIDGDGGGAIATVFAGVAPFLGVASFDGGGDACRLVGVVPFNCPNAVDILNSSSSSSAVIGVGGAVAGSGVGGSAVSFFAKYFLYLVPIFDAA